MKQLKEFFDEYTIKARIFPALTVIGPFIIIIGINLNSLNLTVNILIVVSLLTFLGVISRNLGKKKEDKIIRELGAYQTTILLRYSDTSIDSFTKTRYHKYLNRLLPELNLPVLPDIEENNKNITDDKYNSAVRWLRNNRRDKEKFPLVFKDLTTYGYTRNLYGLKNISIMIYSLLILISMIYFNYENKLSFNISEMEIGVILTVLVLIISLFTLIFGITKQTVISQGYAYARSILETCDE